MTNRAIEQGEIVKLNMVASEGFNDVGINETIKRIYKAGDWYECYNKKGVVVYSVNAAYVVTVEFWTE